MRARTLLVACILMVAAGCSSTEGESDAASTSWGAWGRLYGADYAVEMDAWASLTSEVAEANGWLGMRSACERAVPQARRILNRADGQIQAMPNKAIRTKIRGALERGLDGFKLCADGNFEDATARFEMSTALMEDATLMIEAEPRP